MPSEQPQRGKKRPLMNQHRLLDNTALYRSVWGSVFLKNQVSAVDETIYKNKDREPVLSWTVKCLKNTQKLGKWRPVCFSSPPTAVWKTKPKTWGILSEEERGGGSPFDWQLIVVARTHTYTHTHNKCTHMQNSIRLVCERSPRLPIVTLAVTILPSCLSLFLKGHYRSHSVCTPLGKACTVSSPWEPQQRKEEEEEKEREDRSWRWQTERQRARAQSHLSYLL